MNFLKKGCHCQYSAKVPKEHFAELREAFQALSKSEEVFLMVQLKAMDGGIISTSRRLKKKMRSNKKTYYCWNYNTLLCQETYLNMLGIGKTYLENIRNHLINNGLISGLHGNVKKMPQWKTKMVIDQNVATAVEKLFRKLCWNPWLAKSREKCQ